MPRFKVYHEEYRGDDPWGVGAYDAEHAAEQYAEHWDSGDYTLLRGDEIVVRVEDENGVSKMFRLFGETVPEYHAREVKNEKAKSES